MTIELALYAGALIISLATLWMTIQAYRTTQEAEPE